MLKDEVRTRTYEMAIMQNKHVFKDKVSHLLGYAYDFNPSILSLCSHFTLSSPDFFLLRSCSMLVAGQGFFQCSLLKLVRNMCMV